MLPLDHPLRMLLPESLHARLHAITCGSRHPERSRGTRGQGRRATARPGPSTTLGMTWDPPCGVSCEGARRRTPRHRRAVTDTLRCSFAQADVALHHVDECSSSPNRFVARSSLRAAVAWPAATEERR